MKLLTFIQARFAIPLRAHVSQRHGYAASSIFLRLALVSALGFAGNAVAQSCGVGEVPAAFGFTGGEQTATVPAGVHSLTVYLSGAQGGAGRSGAGSIGGSPNSPGGVGGLGGRVRGTLAVTPGTLLSIWVGGQASQAVNPGGLGEGVDGRGGGATDLRVGGNAIGNRVGIAGGGGGGGNAGWSTANVISGGAGGVGGGGVGGAGATVPGGSGPFGGGGGAVGTGGARGAGCGGFPATAGNAATGKGGNSNNFSGSFIGAGYGGGGGGGATIGAGGGGAGVGTTGCQQNWNGGGGGGSGGSSGATGLTAVTINNGVQAGNGAALVCFAPTQFSVGGTAAGQTGPVTLQVAATNPVSTQQVVVAQAATTYVFPTRLPQGANWNVGVLSAPAGQLCSVSPASGAAINADVTNVALSCVTVAIAVNPATLPNGTFGAAYSQNLSATSANGGVGPYTFAVTAGAVPAGLSLSSAGVLSGTPTAAGSFNFTVRATSSNGFSGSRAYTVAIAQAAQAITAFSANPAAPVFGQNPSFTVSATGGGSGLPVVFSIAPATASVCSASGATITVLTAGTCTVLANQAGNANYSAAPPISQNVSIGLGSQAITGFVANPAAPVFGQNSSFTASATGGASGLPVTFSIAPATAGVCSAGGANGATITVLTAGTCTVLANQAGNTNYSAAPQTSQSVSIGLGSQAITGFVASPAAPVFGQDSSFTVSGTGGASGQPVTFSVAPASASVCSSGGANGATITVTTAGTCTVLADQAGNTNYTAAPQVSQNVSIGKAAQTITFGAQAPQVLAAGGTFSLNPLATSTAPNSGLPIVYTSLTPAVCTVDASAVVTVVASGACQIEATQAGDVSYNSATPVSQSIQVDAPVVSFSGTTQPPAGGAPAGLGVVNITGGGYGCGFDVNPASTAFVAAVDAPPVSYSLSQGLFKFKLIGCDASPVTVSVNWPQPVTGYTKYGKAAAAAAASTYFPPQGLTIVGNVVTFSVKDGQLGDDDWTVNGEIVDPSGPTTRNPLDPNAVPTLSNWGLMLLLALMGMLAGTLNKRVGYRGKR